MRLGTTRNQASRSWREATTGFPGADPLWGTQ